MRITRRRFVGTGIAGGAIAASGLNVIGCGNDVVPAPELPQSVAPSKREITLTLKVVGAGGKLEDKYPDLAPIGGAITVPIAPSGDGVPSAILLIHAGDDGAVLPYIAVSSACPHLGCPLGYSATDKLIECPCHGSRFATAPTNNHCAATKVVHAPALQAPRSYPARLSNDGVSLTISFDVTATAAFSDFPELQTPGGVAVVPTTGSCVAGIVIVRHDANTAVALSAVCTHQGCTVAYSKANNDLECPCHGSRYSLSGSVTNGPATQPLTKLTAVVAADRITVSP
jgi:cytochrome b6-f complex iron-sulfur subunit